MVETRMGRPTEMASALDKMMSIRLSVQEYEQIRLLAQAEDRSVGNWVRSTIRRELENG